MFWYKHGKHLLFILALAAVLPACKPDLKEDGGAMPFFDIKGYFNNEISKLSTADLMVDKTVSRNKDLENRKLKVTDWKQELNLFTSSDINRPAWKNSYSVSADSNLVIYKALEPELKTREILIKLTGGKVKYIMIINDTKNVIFRTQEKLSYFPDSLYLVQKAQTVRFLGVNKYDIKGLFN